MTDKHQETIPKEQYLRLAADFDNYRKRAEAEMLQTVKIGSANVVLAMLDVSDHLAAAIAHAPPDIRSRAEWFKGLEQVGRQFAETMQKLGVRKIGTVGKQYDPATMEAVNMIPGEPSHQVETEVRAGYMMHDRVIRPARVIIYQ